MKVKTGNTLVYKDPQVSALYGGGVVMSVSDVEYVILWARRGSKRYKRSILDHRMAEIFERQDKDGMAPKERHLNLGESKTGIAFNENYDRTRVKSLCDDLQKSRARSAKEVAEGLTGDLFTAKLALRSATKAILLHLAELCGPQRSGDATEVARKISAELFFGYVLRETDFTRALSGEHGAD